MADDPVAKKFKEAMEEQRKNIQQLEEMNRFKQRYWRARDLYFGNMPKVLEEVQRLGKRLSESGMASYHDFPSAGMEIAKACIDYADILIENDANLFPAVLPEFTNMMQFMWGYLKNPKNPHEPVTFDVSVDENGVLRKEAFTDSYKFTSSEKLQKFYDDGLDLWLDSHGYELDKGIVKNKTTGAICTPQEFEDINKEDSTSLKAFLECRFEIPAHAHRPIPGL